MNYLKIEPLQEKTFSSFGEVITCPAEGGYPTNDGTAIRYDKVANLDLTDLKGAPLLSLFRVTPIAFPFQVTKLERHPHSSQAFLALNNCSFLSIVAPPGELKTELVKAFYVPPGIGVNYKRGTWHHQVIALNQETLFLVIGRRGEDKNCDVIELDQTLLLDKGPVAQMDRAEVS